jgi:hypothetical protein
MTHSQTAAAVTTIVLTGEKLATFLAEHPGYIVAAGIAGFASMMYRAVMKANRGQQNA